MKTKRMICLMALLMVTCSAVASAEIVHHWKMDAWSGDTLYVGGNPVTHGIVDSADAPGQGTIAGNSGDPNPAHDPLYLWGPMEGAGADAISSDVAPSAMLNGITSTGSYNFNHVIDQGGNMFYAADQFGNEYDSGSFTAELFFKSLDNTGGTETLLWSKEGHAASHIQLSTGASGTGGLEFWGWDGTGFASLTVTTDDRQAGFQDGLWHYVAARYDTDTNEMSLQVYSEDGSAYSKTQILDNDMILSGGNNNIIVGRQEGEVNRFAGLIDEVRLSTHAMDDAELMAIPEPATVALLGLGGLALLKRRRA
ncbi:hypothetical protein STSP2_02110 [Anaerohalosphaera lusitana]|uniref:LamG-like jellyroll fold domain-containing protein n=1 Tax=Anaerohalosphaera lusitana TaxID=1936003 RepID=A0A1U9NLX7_9BACT|nr:LamG-like jellyroll fold domain-containing protein [Anaerohalosphaera lusitana]AQT68933.1 hypothetical protein STSP2_02110 [Anaerohalosphaera lusitana]